MHRDHFLLVVLVTFISAAQADPPITWSVLQITHSAITGTVSTLQVRFTNNVPLPSVRVNVVPELGSFVATSPRVFNAVPAGTTQTLTILFKIPRSTSAGTLLGSIHLVDASDTSKTFAPPLPVQLDIQQP